ncbi:FKBP-type peptidyl-prolyl cis-trans isomerase [Alteromonas sp. ASW11-36]|uniref:Peptidyl-prolyl cis-trans isomerase n=1 Tax=Alteromonas arenosi TaxID=3055817 RepID=A0ABT7SZ73_9ALTE|nr:FKBP-type peptidyl-prolyl cis-trans isomerase [Alteromonas sp. ASW11-36]MDM7861489.1 FKBP-type peptidyl-prolyl cis-trans isomerase [Alteromonas sp. ASW11-36]
MSEKYSTIELQASYGIGYNMGQQLAQNPFEGMQVDAVVDGVRDAFNQVAPQVADDALRAAFETIHQRMQEAKAEQHKAVIEEGVAFLADNAKRDEVTVTASGLQYEVLTEGEGATPDASSTVRTHYHGTLIDGSVFDSSYDRGQPAEFPVGGVIKGWTEALQLMKVGAKWRLYVPHNLAYGEQGAGGAIGPYATLVFDVELLDIL